MQDLMRQILITLCAFWFIASHSPIQILFRIAAVFNIMNSYMGFPYYLCNANANIYKYR